MLHSYMHYHVAFLHASPLVHSYMHYHRCILTCITIISHSYMRCHSITFAFLHALSLHRILTCVTTILYRILTCVTTMLHSYMHYHVAFLHASPLVHSYRHYHRCILTCITIISHSYMRCHSITFAFLHALSLHRIL